MSIRLEMRRAVVELWITAPTSPPMIDARVCSQEGYVGQVGALSGLSALCQQDHQPLRFNHWAVWEPRPTNGGLHFRRFAYDALRSAFPNTNVPCRPGLVIACRRQVSRSAATNKPVASPTQIPVGPVCKLNAKINPVGIAAAQ